jgi:transcriptional regulator with XRE-family HTH domain
MGTANRIRELREGKGIRQVHMAAAFNVDQSTVHRWEQIGPPAQVIPDLAKYLEADPSYMMGWEREAA